MIWSYPLLSLFPLSNNLRMIEPLLKPSVAPAHREPRIIKVSHDKITISNFNRFELFKINVELIPVAWFQSRRYIVFLIFCLLCEIHSDLLETARHLFMFAQVKMISQFTAQIGIFPTKTYCIMWIQFVQRNKSEHLPSDYDDNNVVKILHNSNNYYRGIEIKILEHSLAHDVGRVDYKVELVCRKENVKNLRRQRSYKLCGLNFCYTWFQCSEAMHTICVPKQFIQLCFGYSCS